jgi:uncharacterized protein (DUF433 family)
MREPFVSSPQEAADNILRYGSEVRGSAPLRERSGYVRSWYARKDNSGQWRFAPSKFIGYRNPTAKNYLGASGNDGERDGRQTERVLSEWFTPAEAGSRLERELAAALRRFLSEIEQAPNARARISVLNSDIDEPSATSATADGVLDRISSNPAICGGRPCIKGTRMRVADIVEAIAHGASQQELLADFDYLSAEDITAALLYAARATAHRIVRTA